MGLLRTLEALDVKPVAVGRLITSIYEQFSDRTASDVVEEALYSMMPKFVYFDEYSTMHGRISIQDMLRRVEAEEDLSESDRTFMSLLSLVGADLDDLQNQTNYEYMKAELESASISISDEMFEYWAQNKQLRVEFDLSAADPNDLPPLNEGTILHVRIWNNRHRVSVPFDDRSKGFVWFFSFLTYFSSIEEQEECDLVLLLDEPGLNLHALAQNDFLRFIDERLAPKHQVVYTTHSPFMINLNHLDRIRTVQDVDDKGTVISSDALSNDQDTVFPHAGRTRAQPGAYAVPRAALPHGELGGRPDLPSDTRRDMRQQRLPAAGSALGRHTGGQARITCPCSSLCSARTM